MQTLAEFDAKWVPEPYSGCWLWTGSAATNNGYGNLRWRGRHALAHRVAWLLYRGPIPSSFRILHKCDTPSCVNPSHLFLGTQSDNMRDAASKGKFQLSAEKAKAMRRAVRSRYPVKP